MKYASIISLLSLFLFSTLSFADAFPGAESEIPEFHLVSKGLYRGGRPSAEGLKELAKLGVKTIVNLDNDREQVEREADLAADLNIVTYSRPMSGFSRPSDQNVDAILALLADQRNYPLFVHCQHGQDRTGLIVGLHRVFAEGWSAERAYDEMLEYNFHSILLYPLYDYFRDRTEGRSLAHAFP